MSAARSKSGAALLCVMYCYQGNSSISTKSLKVNGLIVSGCLVEPKSIEDQEAKL